MLNYAPARPSVHPLKMAAVAQRTVDRYGSTTAPIHYTSEPCTCTYTFKALCLSYLMEGVLIVRPSLVAVTVAATLLLMQHRPGGDDDRAKQSERLRLLGR